MTTSVRHEPHDQGGPLEPGGLKRSVIAVVTAPEWVPDPDATANGPAQRVGAIGLAIGSLRLCDSHAELEFKNVQGYTVRGFYPAVGSERPCDDELALLMVTATFIREQPSPMIVTWGKNYFDVAHLRHRAFSQGAIADWLMPTVAGGVDCLRTAKHIDLCKFLYPEGLTISFEEALECAGVMPQEKCNVLEKLEICATGLHYLVARALFYKNMLTALQYREYRKSYFEYLAEIAKMRNHFAILVPNDSSA